MWGVLVAALSASLGLQQPWLYSTVSNRGPARWGSLTGPDGTPLYPGCGGSRQSPLSITEATIDAALLPLLYAYQTSARYNVVHMRAFVRIVFLDDAGFVADPNAGGKRFRLKHVDVHAPAEHAVAGGLADLELQLVHTADPADPQPAAAAPFAARVTLATAILFTSAPGVGPVPLLATVLAGIPAAPISANDLYLNGFAAFDPASATRTVPVNMADVLPVPWTSIRHSSKEREYFTYEGSLTSPADGCQEGVWWYVYAHGVRLPADQLQALRTALGVVEEEVTARRYGFPVHSCEVFGNNRPPQPANGRAVTMYSLSGIAEEGKRTGATDPSTVTPAEACTDTQQQPWLYAETAARGPSDWANVAPQTGQGRLYPACGLQRQAPVDLKEAEAAVSAALRPLDFQYGTAVGYTVGNDQAALRLTFTTPTGYVIDPNLGKRFELTHVVFRTPAEHSIEGGHHALEMQLMHKQTLGQAPGAPSSPQYLGVSVLFRADDAAADNPFLAKMWGHLQGRPLTPGEQLTSPYAAFRPAERVGLTEPLDLLAGLPAAKGYYTYEGSLTQPPCTEGAVWYVFTTPNSVSAAQVAAARLAMNFTGELEAAAAGPGGFVPPPRCVTFGNNRPTQPLNGRVLRRTPDAPAVKGALTSARGGAAAGDTSVCRDQPWLYTNVLGRGPQSWGTMAGSPTTTPPVAKPLFPTCGAGRSQSPVRVDQARIDSALVPLAYAYVRGTAFTVQNWQSVMKVVFASSPGLVTDANMGMRRFAYQEMHIHAPSEHAVGDGLRQMEVVMVHKATADQPALARAYGHVMWLHVSVLFELEAADNEFLAAFWGNLQPLPRSPQAQYGAPTDPVTPTVSAVLAPDLDLTRVLPRVQDFFTYDGSKTAPPCTEGVRWYVYTTPAGVSAAQLAAFRGRMGFAEELAHAVRLNSTAAKAACETFGNNRPLQELNGRVVKMHTTSGVAHEGAVQGATNEGAATRPPGTTVTTSASDVVQIVDASAGGSGKGACGAGGTGYQPWGYADVAQRGPSSWGAITAQGGGPVLFPTCAGTADDAAQSPVDVAATAADPNLREPTFTYNTVCRLRLENNQRAQVLTVSPAPWRTAASARRRGDAQAEPPQGSTPPPTAACVDSRSLGYLQDPNLGSKRYELSHVEFHAPSEHQLAGGNYDMEVQLHHREAVGQPPEANLHGAIRRVSVAVLLQVSETDNPVLERFWNELRTPPLDPTTLYSSAWQAFVPSRGVGDVAAVFSARELLPTGSGFVTYRGSVTVPPCTEGVQWYVYTTPLSVGRRQLALFRERMGFDAELARAKQLGLSPSKCATFGNNRPVQPLKGRVLRAGGTSGDAPPARGPVTSVHTADARCATQPWVYAEGGGGAGRGPSKWGTMLDEAGAAPLYPGCASGGATGAAEQSPVDISAALLEPSLLPLGFAYQPQAEFRVENNNRNGRVVFENPDGVRGHVSDPNLGDRRFDLQNLHFHSPSEHSVNGGLYDMEMHITHRASAAASQPAGGTAASAARYTDLVVTVLFEEGPDDNPWLASFWDHLQLPPLTAAEGYADPHRGFHSAQSPPVPGPLLVEAALPPSLEYFTYDGSFTEPPCTEGVKWYVYRTPQRVSRAQLEAYRRSLNVTGELAEAARRGYHPKPCTRYGNNRPTQPLGTRRVKMSGTVGVAGTGQVAGATGPGQWAASAPAPTPQTPGSVGNAGGCAAEARQQPWLYAEAGGRGPSRWGSLAAPPPTQQQGAGGSGSGAATYAKCDAGVQQSPANMAEAVPDAALKELVYRYAQLGAYDVVNDQATLRLAFKAGDAGMLQDPNTGDTRYEVTGVTFKTPSEHTVGGKHFDAEMQVWHRRATGQPPAASGEATLAVSVLFRADTDTSNAWLDGFWGLLPSDPLSASAQYAGPYEVFTPRRASVARELRVEDALPAVREYFTYQGSETTPPCTEGKTWYVYSAPASLSRGQLAALRAALGLTEEATEAAKAGFDIKPCTQFGNVRPVQPLNARTIRMKSATGVAPLGTVTGATDAKTDDATCAPGAAAPLPWHYEEVGGRGPASWATMAGGGYPTCGGDRQSPVALDSETASVDSSLRPLEHRYAATGAHNAFRLHNDGRELRMSFSESPGWVVDPNQGNRKYSLTHLTFHTPSEHSIGGGRHSVEVVLHHTLASGQGVVGSSGWALRLSVSVLLEARTAENPWLNSFWAALPKTPRAAEAAFATPDAPVVAATSASSTVQLDPAGVLPSSGGGGAAAGVFSYDGSDTAPPCDEGVRHYVHASPQVVGHTQVRRLRDALGADAQAEAAKARGVSLPDPRLVGNARPTQPLGGRVVSYAGAAPAKPGALTPPGQGAGTTVPATAAPGDPSTLSLATVVVPGMPLAGVSQASRDAVAAAARLDLAGAFGVGPERLTVELFEDASSGGSLFFWTLDTSGHPSPALLRENIQSAYRGRRIRMPRAEAAYRSATGRRDASADVDFARSQLLDGTSAFLFNAKVAVTGVDMAKVPAGQAGVLEAAARRDLAATYGVHPSRVAGRVLSLSPVCLRQLLFFVIYCSPLFFYARTSTHTHRTSLCRYPTRSTRWGWRMPAPLEATLPAPSTHKDTRFLY